MTLIEVEAPEPDLTPQALVERARAMRDDLRERQQLTEELTRVPDEIHQQFLDAGFYRILQPRRFGGYQFSLRDFDRLIIEVARGCPSSGWQLSLATGHAVTIATHFPEEAQREIFGPDGDFRAPLPVSPTGKAVRADDGYVVSGRWDFASGSPVSTHFLAVCLIEDGDGPPVPGLVCLADGWEMLDNWGTTIGMRGSGSNSVVVADAHVSEHNVVRVDIHNLDLSEGTPGGRLHGDPMYAGQTLSFFNLELVPIIVGTAWAAVDEYEQILQSKNALIPPMRLRRELPEHQRTYGLAVARTESAQRILLEAADDYVRLARRGMEGGEPFTVVDDRQLAMSVREAALMASDVVDMVAAAAGTAAVFDGQRMQRYLRDISVYRTHINAQQGFWAGDLGAALLGAEFEWTLGHQARIESVKARRASTVR